MKDKTLTIVYIHTDTLRECKSIDYVQVSYVTIVVVVVECGPNLFKQKQRNNNNSFAQVLHLCQKKHIFFSDKSC